MSERGADHRSRLLAAMADEIGEQGFRGLTVADVVRRARTSRRTFYEHFDDREACLAALLHARNARTVAVIEDAVDASRPLEEQVEAAVGAWIAEESADPALTATWIREVPALGRAGRELTQQALDAFAGLVLRLAERAGVEVDPDTDPLLAVVLVGGLRELVVRAVEDDHDLDRVRRTAVTAARRLLLGEEQPAAESQRSE